jgi:hypothetical protein
MTASLDMKYAPPRDRASGYGTALGEILSQLAPEIRAATLLQAILPRGSL